MSDAPEEYWGRASRAVRILASTPAALALVTPLLILGLGGADISVQAVLRCACLALLYLVAYRSPFESSVGSSVPTQPVLMAALLTCPLEVVPLMVLLAVLIGGWLDGKRGFRSLGLEGANALHAIAPVAVLWHTRDVHDVAHPAWWLLVVSVACQLLVDGLTAYLNDRPYSTRVREMARPLLWTWTIDSLMAVIGWGLTVAVAGGIVPLMVVLTAPILLVRFLAADRETYLSHSLAMHDAYAEADAAARRDPMTGLANRLGWEQAMDQAQLALQSGPTERGCTVLCADMDRLKLANDHFGHETGDRLIIEFAALLQDCAPSDATVARLGGDEFAVLVVAPVRRGPIDLIAPVRQALLSHDAGLPVKLSASLGQAHVRTGEPISQAVSEADHAARQDKLERNMSRENLTPDFTPGAPGVRGPGSPSGIRVFRS